jgi:hypothetical protein
MVLIKYRPVVSKNYVLNLKGHNHKRSIKPVTASSQQLSRCCSDELAKSVKSVFFVFVFYASTHTQFLERVLRQNF